jgi:hypothetical protein
MLSEYIYSFNYSVSILQQYKLAYLIPILPITISIIIFTKGFHFSRARMILSCLLVFCFIKILFSKYYGVSNEYLFVIILFILIFFCGSFFFTTKDYIVLLIFIVTIFFAEIILGIDQFLNYPLSFQNGSLHVCGSFHNSGIYACYVVIGIPFQYYFFVHYNSLASSLSKKSTKELSDIESLPVKAKSKIISQAFKFFFGLEIILCVVILYVTESRTALMSLLVTSFFITFYEYQSKRKSETKKLNKKHSLFLTFGIVLFFSFILYHLFYLKKLSAFGRILMWEVTWNNIKEYFWFGTGLGRLVWYYPQWQAQYFATHISVPREFFLSAGESYIIFNEYLQFLKEIGFIGVTGIFILLYHFFTTKSENNKFLLNSVKASMVAILACCFTSYPLHVNSFLFLFFFCIVVSSAIRENHGWFEKKIFLKSPLLPKLTLLLLVIFSIFTIFKTFRQSYAANKFSSIYNSPTKEGTLNRYSELYEELCNDGKFLTAYGSQICLHDTEQLKAIKILEEAKQFYISNETIKKLAQAYSKTNNISKAIENQKWLNYYLPNNFHIKYELLELYIQNHDFINARETADIILSMPVKIPSPEVTAIQIQTRNLLLKLKNDN